MLSDVGLVFPRTGICIHFGKVLLIDQDLWQRFAIEFDRPASIRSGADIHVGYQSLRNLIAEREPGFGVEPPKLLDHVRNIFCLDTAARDQRSVVVGSKQIKISERAKKSDRPSSPK